MAERAFTNWEDIPLLLTTDEAAALLRLHVNTVKYLIRNGKLAATKVGRAWRIPREAVLAVRDGVSDDALRAVALDLMAALQPFAALDAPGTTVEAQYRIPTEWLSQAQDAMKRAEKLGLSNPQAGAPPPGIALAEVR
jgi:excisionase family DNA binding protein